MLDVIAGCLLLGFGGAFIALAGLIMLDDRRSAAAARRLAIDIDSAAIALRIALGNRQEGATKRSIELLCKWLSPTQLVEFEQTRGFMVIGSEGRRYLVSAYMTLEQNDDGDPIGMWCFAPYGFLPAGDVLLGRKIALETDEGAVRSIGNFSPGLDGATGCIVAGRGTIEGLFGS